MAVVPIRSEENLPESCAIVSAMAVTELTQKGIWARPLGVMVQRPDGETARHILTTFSFANRTYAYDSTGSYRLETNSLNIDVIVAKIQAKLQPGWKITAYKWLDED